MCGSAALDFVLTGAIMLVPPRVESLTMAKALMEKYKDFPMDFADATLVSLAHDLSIQHIVIFDRKDFGIYRLHKTRSFIVVPYYQIKQFFFRTYFPRLPSYGVFRRSYFRLGQDTHIDSTQEGGSHLRRKEGHILNLKYSATYLARVFGGELVSQDTKDEPASVLLERILAEREKQSELKKKARTRAVSKKRRKRKLSTQRLRAKNTL